MRILGGIFFFLVVVGLAFWGWSASQGGPAVTLTADPSTAIKAGDEVKIKFQAPKAREGVLEYQTKGDKSFSMIGALDVSDLQKGDFFPSYPTLDTTYRLTVKDNKGQVVQKDLLVKVTPAQVQQPGATATTTSSPSPTASAVATTTPAGPSATPIPLATPAAGSGIDPALVALITALEAENARLKSTNGLASPTGPQGSAGAAGFGPISTCPDADRLIEPDPDWKGKTARNTPSDPSKIVKTAFGCIIQGDVLIAATKDGIWIATFDNDPKTGSIGICRIPTGCYVYSQWGTDIGSSKTICELEAEAKARGCEGGCREISKWNLNDKGGLGKEPDCSGTPTTPGLAPQVNSTPVPTGFVDCGFELQPAEVRLVPAGCFIAGDVEAYIGPPTTAAPAVPASREDLLRNWKSLHDSDQYSGVVIKITRDTWILAIYGAGLHSPDLNIDGLRASMILSGCHTGIGCRRIDQTASNYP